MSRMFETNRDYPGRPKDKKINIGNIDYNISWTLIPPAVGFILRINGNKTLLVRHYKKSTFWRKEYIRGEILELEGKTVVQIITEGLLDKYIIS